MAADDWDPFADPAEEASVPLATSAPALPKISTFAPQPRAHVGAEGGATVPAWTAAPEDTARSSGVSGRAAVTGESASVRSETFSGGSGHHSASPVKDSGAAAALKGGAAGTLAVPTQHDEMEEAEESEEEAPPMSTQKRDELIAEVVRLKAEKQRAVEEEEFEEAAALKRRIKVLEDTLGEQVQYEERKAAKEAASKSAPSMHPAWIQQKKPISQQQHGEALSLMPSDDMKLIPEEREFVTKSRLAMRSRGVTDDLVNGVPQWAYKDAARDGLQGVKTERPAELQYVFRGQIEDEKWEPGANFQTTVIIQVPLEVAFAKTLGLASPSDAASGDRRVAVGPAAYITHHASGTAQLTELLDSELIEHEVVVFRITVTKPKVPGKVKLEAAQTVQTKQAFLSKPFYSFKSVWRFRMYPAGGTHVTRLIFDFKQFELLEFDALRSVSRSIELEDESIRQSWSVAVAIAPEKTLASKPSPWRQPQDVGQQRSDALSKKSTGGADQEMYSASFVVDANADHVFEALASQEFVQEYNRFLKEDSVLHLDEHRSIVRQVNGIVSLMTTRTKADQKQLLTMVVSHIAGNSFDAAMAITTDKPIMSNPFYRVVCDWICLDHGENETLVKRTMRDFKQMSNFEISDLAQIVTEAADEENRRIMEAFQKRKLQEGRTSSRSIPSAISSRANYAMRQMPEILDHAAKNNVLEVREMLEVRGADPNYIHVRQDSWAISDSRLVFYEEITPLIVAAEHGACDVIKVLFNHPQIDVNLCCCAFNDLEIYNYYTAYDMTISKKHPHAAALLRARGVLPASSEHVFKPPFDRVSMRPLRETINHTYNWDEATGENEMPSWEMITEGDPKLAAALREVADTLSITNGQAMARRTKIFKSLVTDWHPDRHTSSGDATIATKVFQWLQLVKPWYFEASEEPEMDQQPLPGFDNPDRPTAPSGAQQYLHPSGSVFQVW